MKTSKKLLGIATIVGGFAVATIGISAAQLGDTPADIVGRLTGRDATDVRQERIDTSKTYGQIADEAGVLDAFKEENLDLKKQIVQEKVDNGQMTQDNADQLIQNIEENQVNCDGTGSAQLGQGAGLGAGQGMGAGNGLRDGSGAGQGMGAGNGLQDGSGAGQGARGQGGNGQRLRDGSRLNQ